METLIRVSITRLHFIFHSFFSPVYFLSTRLHHSQLVFNLLHYSSFKPFNPSNRNHPLSSILVTTLIFLSLRKFFFPFFVNSPSTYSGLGLAVVFFSVIFTSSSIFLSLTLFVLLVFVEGFAHRVASETNGSSFGFVDRLCFTFCLRNLSACMFTNVIGEHAIRLGFPLSEDLAAWTPTCRLGNFFPSDLDTFYTTSTICIWDVRARYGPR